MSCYYCNHDDYVDELESLGAKYRKCCSCNRYYPANDEAKRIEKMKERRITTDGRI